MKCVSESHQRKMAKTKVKAELLAHFLFSFVKVKKGVSFFFKKTNVANIFNVWMFFPPLLSLFFSLAILSLTSD